MKNHRHTATAFILLLLTTLSTRSAALVDESHYYLVGRGIADITGPALGIPMWGFGYAGQVTEGIHIRLKARTFIISELKGNKRLVFVIADIGSIEHNITLEVIDRLRSLYGDVYSLENVILSATHTHSGPGGYWHTRTDLELAGEFYREHFDSIVAGIVGSIATAHGDLQPGTILINRGSVEGAGINRSLIAYEQNPEEERKIYSNSINKEMTLLKFANESGDIGMINWYAVHPTSMTYYNRLISGDNKGYASLEFERTQNNKGHANKLFVGAFAQADAGDVTPNLNLDNTGPGADDFESARIIGDRQRFVARVLFDDATEKVEGKIDYRQIYIDLSNFQVSDKFTGSDSRYTCPSAYGYSFAGGSTEDGGGHFLFKEGMTDQNFFLDFLVRILTGAPGFTPKVKACQTPKPILWETGTGTPPLQSQIRSVSVVRIGQLVIVAVPAEVTTMAGRRMRNAVMAQLSDWARYIVIAGYSNGYAGYVTTPEEYRLQQYEGGHTLHGQWTLPAYRQVIAQLATALENGTEVKQNTIYDDWRGKSISTPLQDGKPDRLPEGVWFGDAIPMNKIRYTRGQIVTARFWSSNPTANYKFDGNFINVEQRHNNLWITVANDHDWSTKIRWQRDLKSYVAEITWKIPLDIEPGEFRIKHSGRYTRTDGAQQNFEGFSGNLQVE